MVFSFVIAASSGRFGPSGVVGVGSICGVVISFATLRARSTACLSGESVTAPRGCVADKRSSLVSSDLGNRGKVPQVSGTSQKGSRLRLSFHNSEIEVEAREELGLDRN